MEAHIEVTLQVSVAQGDTIGNTYIGSGVKNHGLSDTIFCGRDTVKTITISYMSISLTFLLFFQFTSPPVAIAASTALLSPRNE